MTIQEAYRILERERFIAYFGSGYTSVNAIQYFMEKHPRGKGLKQHMKRELKLYEACLVYQQNRSRTKKYLNLA